MTQRDDAPHSRSRLLLALERMIESVREDIIENAGNHATVAALDGERKGLMAALAYAESEEARVSESVAPVGPISNDLLVSMRNQVLEEAAKVCDGLASKATATAEMKHGLQLGAVHIRALKNAAPRDRMDKGSGVSGNSPATNDASGDLPAAAAPFSPTPNRHADLVRRLRIRADGSFTHSLTSLLVEAADAMERIDQRNAP